MSTCLVDAENKLRSVHFGTCIQSAPRALLGCTACAHSAAHAQCAVVHADAGAPRTLLHARTWCAFLRACWELCAPCDARAPSITCAPIRLRICAFISRDLRGNSYISDLIKKTHFSIKRKRRRRNEKEKKRRGGKEKSLSQRRETGET